MCGICGFVNLDGAPASVDLLKKMSQKIFHRGPDESGQFIHKNVALGSQRLSIIDLQGGKQPIHDENERYWIVYNGEVYNFQELKETYLKKHSFYTRTDTEVIIHLFEKMGTECIKLLNGMFAFAIYDKQKDELILARDKIGKKPLYYAHGGKHFIFASELKSILEHPFATKELDMDSIKKFFIYEYIPSPHSPFKSIKKLPPGHLVILSNGSIKITPYYKLHFGHNEISTNDAIGNIRNLLDKAVKRRLVADVPIGLYLSSGLDSTTVLAYMAKHVPPQNIRTFSIGFNDPDFDESKLSRLTSERFGTEHKDKIFEINELTECLMEIATFLDEPFADPSILPTFLLSKFTRSHVKVALSGDGGDELFLGYPTFLASFLARNFERLPRAFRRALKQMSQFLPTSFGNISTDYKIKQFFKGLEYDEKIRNQIWIGAFTEHEIGNLLNTKVSSKELLDDIYTETSDVDNFMDQVNHFYFRFYLSDGVLCKVDRASMACSLEVRSPLLDDELIDFVTSLRIDQRFRPKTPKYLLKEATKGLLPDTTSKKKKGFAIPLARLLENEAKPLMLDILSEKRCSHDFFNHNLVKKLIDEHLSHEKDNRRKLFCLIMFQLWFENYSK